ncbi:opia protein [Pycnococcus provasolii]
MIGITGFVAALVGQGAFAWRSTKQSLVAQSSTESELIALADSCNAVIITRRLLGELGLINKPTQIFEDNMSAITILSDIIYSGRTKHIDVRLKSIRDRLQDGSLKLTYVPTDRQLADMFTKGLAREKFSRLRRSVIDGDRGTCSGGVSE